ncbi:hypothetical protein A4D02_29945 [Niastella koreensis]|uniref:PKD domain containing protein n=2 Tax=Niastella koreensis TaxID=354356 RepID=G8T6M7_NIAKG|nr:PKD domain-containing protein [Niastella koreensis]AEV96872.1 PKD domain containing protein [Niastella koreensis GR20-10]OQP49217.1 hypothetical protein A4D02_29945 [Niastella koreensis]
MLPVNYVYPKFVPDQLLTSDDLNELFCYLDKQGRLTRTNLIGIGIVCGMEVQLNSAKTVVTITEGTGVTSAGYLINVPLRNFPKASLYDPVKEKYYSKFVNTAADPKTKKFDLWELKEVDDETGDINITESFLSDKVVLYFVELLEVNNKNCDPNSCDDKGIHVNVTFRPLLVKKVDAGTLIGATGSQTIDLVISLAEVRMRRFDVPNTSPVTSTNIFDAYKAVLTKPFIVSIEATLTAAWNIFKTYAQAEYQTTNPFAGLANEFEYINNGSISTHQLQHIQYIYDFFSDVLQTYDEFRRTGKHVLSICCPDCDLFPRHLLLGEAIPLAAGTASQYRQYFLYSPLFEQRDELAQLQILFKKLVLIVQQFFLPAVSTSTNSSKLDDYIRITPSILGDVDISKKAIPYYYHAVAGPYPLYKSWSLQKTLQGIPQRNLSYNAKDYNGTDDFVLNPLLYDLEPYNFLRIEGIIGKSYVKVLQNLKAMISQNRLPVDVIALNTENTNLLQGINTSNASAFSGVIDDINLEDMVCYFQDLDALYAAMKNELLCNLCKELKYYYDLGFGIQVTNSAETETKVDLLNTCSPGYKVRSGTFGYYIEQLYAKVGDSGNVTMQIIAALFNLEGTSLHGTLGSFVGYLVDYFEVPVYIIRLANTITDDLSAFEVEEYCRIHQYLSDKANAIKFAYDVLTSDTEKDNEAGLTIIKNLLRQNTADRVLSFFRIEDLFDHLDALIYSCKCAAFKAIKAEYLQRVVKLTLLRQFGYFTKQHPGIQHKAGVPMGGTFIIVYHNRPNTITKGRAFGIFILKGKVTDEEGELLHSVSITIKETGQQTKADAEGNFSIRIKTLPTVLVFRASHYEPKEVTITSDNPITVRMGIDDKEEPQNAIGGIVAGTVIADFYLPYRCCSDCPPIQYVVPEIKDTPPANQGPIADAGTDQVITLPANTVVLNGSASTDPDGSITQFQWVRLSGPNTPQIVTPNSSQSGVTGLVQGVYEFELTVTDNKGSTARDSMLVTVNPAPHVNQPPVANAGTDRTYTISTANPLVLDGSASTDPDGTIQSYKWERASGPNTPVIVAPNSVQTPVTALVPGEYEFKLTVTDNEGASASASVKITVALPENKPPVANAGIDQVITLPVNTVTLNGSSSVDPDGAIKVFSWNLKTGPNTPLFGTPDAAITQVSGLAAGSYEFELKVQDDRGATATDTVAVTVNRAPEKSCTSFHNITVLFGSLKDTDPNNFALFTRLFQFYPQVAAYFKQLDADQVLAMPIDKQIDFFATPIGGAGINVLLLQWLKQLNELILANTENLRTLALALYRILMLLSMYIACIQKEDADKAKVPMDEVFRLIEENTKAWADLNKQKPFAAPDMDIIKQIFTDLKTEEARIISNGEATIKPVYLELIRAIIKILDTIV